MLKIRHLATITLVTSLAVGLAAAVSADPSEGGVVNVDQGSSGDGGATVSVGAEHSGSAAGSGSGAGVDRAGSRTDGAHSCTYLGVEIDCTSSEGVWSEQRQCFVQRMPRAVTPDNPYDGHTDGAVYWCATPGSAGGGRLGVGSGSDYLFWAPAPGASGAPVLVDPVSLAERAVERMELAAPRIGMTPLRRGAPLLVGMDAWLWIDNAGPHDYGPITRSATAGPTTVTATARVTNLTWDLGDGTRLTCSDAGTPWSPDLGTGPSPTCGHRYLQSSVSEPDGTFTVRATAHWRVTWSGAGQSGRITFQMTGQRQQEVTEVQVLQVR